MLTSSYFKEIEKSKALFRVNGSFDEIAGDVITEGNVIYSEKDGCRISCEYTEDEYGIFSRRDTFKNMSNKAVRVNSLKSRFVFDGGEYDIYTQREAWQCESLGAWQPLVTAVSCGSASTRTSVGASPMMVVWSKQQNRGVVFHLLPNCAWEIKVQHMQRVGKFGSVLVELGVQDYNFDMEVQPGEEVELPEIICYETQNKLDFDCYKLHNYMHTNYPRRTLPFVYNSWMYRFTSFTPDQLFEQAKLAAEMGLEYFVIDAGWFGKDGIWITHVGDWVENKIGGLCGRMKELSDYVRSLGMKFGVWLEPERAGAESDIVITNPDEFFVAGGHRFLDFSNPKAYKHIFDTISGLIDEYNVEYIKFDYNANMYYDQQHNGLLTYHKYRSKFFNELKEKHPNVYFTCCAGGGEQMELNNYARFDSYWPTDNESPHIGMRIFRDTILRMPPQGFEKWTAIHSMDKYADHYLPFDDFNLPSERIIASGDAKWGDLHGVHRSFLDGYHTACPICFSCDLSEISEDLREHFKQRIAKVKEERKYWQNVVARILANTETVTIYQFSDMALTKINIQIFTRQIIQEHVRVYPCLDADKTYLINGEIKKSGAEIMKEGIKTNIPRWNDATGIVVEEV